MDVQLTEHGATGVFWMILRTVFPCYSGTAPRSKALPAGVFVLATSPDCAVQAMSWGRRAYSVQFHVEIEEDTVDAWAEIPEYAAALNTLWGKWIGSVYSRCQRKHVSL